MNKQQSTYVTRHAEPSRENPWAHHLATTMKRKNKTMAVGKSRSIIDTRTGEITGEIAITAIRKPVDREEFVKIFEGGISNIFALNKSAKDLFQAILLVYLNQKMKAEQVYINGEILKEVGYQRSRSLRTAAMNTLLNLGFLCEVTDQPLRYWINPNMFFKGDRMQIFQDIVVRGTPAEVQQKKEIAAIEERAKQQSLFNEGE